MEKFLFKLIFFGLILSTLVFGVDYLIQEGIKTSSYREISKWNEVIQGGIDAEILIVGSSRALVHFDPRIIEEKTGMTCYNLGLDGSKYEAQKKVLELYLEKNIKPKTIIWSLDFNSFQKTKGIYRYEQFIPYWPEKKVKELMSLNSGMDLGYLDFPIIRFSNNSTIKYRGVLASLNLQVEEKTLNKGYRQPYQTWDSKFDSFEMINSEGVEIEIDSILMNEFMNLNLELLEKEIQIQWVCTPYYDPALKLILNRESIIDVFASQAKILGIDYKDYSYSEISFNKNYFYNGSHLRNEGVFRFLNCTMKY